MLDTYRPQWTDNEYWSRLKHAIELAHQINENIVISGDLNSNLFNVNNNKLVDLMTTFNLSSYCQMFLVIEHEVGFGHLRKATAASGSLISGGNLKTSRKNVLIWEGK
jgi:hypothetical protein